MQDMISRIPTLYGVTPAPTDLAFTPGTPTTHSIACRCCQGRNPIARRLTDLFVARARAQVAWFTRVVVIGTPQDWENTRTAIRQDRLAAARFEVPD